MKNKLLACVAIALAPVAAHAVPITYSFDGPDLSNRDIIGVATLSGTFTVDIEPSSFSFDNVPVLDYSFFDGVTTYDSTNHSVAASQFWTDDAGVITEYNLQLSPNPEVVPFPVDLGQGLQITSEFFGNTASVIYGGARSASARGSNYLSLVSAERAGAVPVSEPGTLSLLGLGILALVLRRRSRVA